jgi:integrase
MATDARFKFTEPRVENFAYSPGKRTKCKYVIAWDTETPGLGLRVTEAGARRYIFDKRIKHGRSVRMTIGDPKSRKLGDARVRARELTVLADRGRDPRLEVREQREADEAVRLEAARRDHTFEAAWLEYVADRTPHWGERHLRNHTELAHAGGVKKKRGKGKTRPGPLAALMPLKLDELTAERITAWLKREAAKRQAVAAQAYRALRAFITWAKDTPAYAGIIPGNATTARTVRDHVPRARAKSDSLQREQLAAWFDAVRRIPNRTISAFLQTVMLTGGRRGEVAALHWTDVQFKWGGALTIRDKATSHGKDAGSRTIPLTPYVASLLSALPRNGEFVFPAHRGDGHLVEARKAHRAAQKSAGIDPPVSIHGLRRSFGSLSEWCELPTGIVAQLMGHAASALAEKHYRVRPLDLLRKWHGKLEAWILSEGKVPFAASKGAEPASVTNVDETLRSAA